MENNFFSSLTISEIQSIFNIFKHFIFLANNLLYEVF